MIYGKSGFLFSPEQEKERGHAPFLTAGFP
jgi:hypothetical protein